MKSFSISRDQIASIISALVAEEISRDPKRHVDFLTASSWQPDTSVGGAGAGLTKEEFSICTKRVANFFGSANEFSGSVATANFSDWVRHTEAVIATGFETIMFTPAGHSESDPGCVHPTDRVFGDAAAAANLFHGRRRLLSLVAPHSLLGFTLTVLTPNLQRVQATDARALTPLELQKTLQFGDVLVATPSLWRYVLKEGVTAPDNTMGVSFGEPMTPELSADMRQAGFGAQREIYGSTETGLIGWRDSPTEPFVLFDHWSRKGDDLVRSDSTEDSAPVAAMDVLSWVDGEKFILAGRRDGAVQIGAVNVFPDKIATTLCGHIFVRDCVVRVGKRKAGVNRLIAHISLIDTAPPTEKTVRDIDQFCRKMLRPQERPSIFHFEAELESKKGS